MPESPSVSTLRSCGVALVRFTQRPSVRMFVGATLLITGVDDLVEELTGSEGLLDVGLFHGVTVLGLQQVLHSFGQLLEGVHETGRHALGAELAPGHQVLDPRNPGQVVVDDGDHQRHQ
jgi:hypothetical protein